MTTKSDLTMKEIEEGNAVVTGIYTVARDGGSVYFQIKLNDVTHSLILDHRLSTETYSEFFYGGALGTDSAVSLGKSKKLYSAVEEALKQKRYLKFDFE